MELPVIGRTDKIDLPELGFINLPVKVDTGADSCSLHCEMIEYFVEEDTEYVRFLPLDDSFPQFKDKPIVMECHTEKSIRSSNGELQNRYFIQTTVKIFGKLYETEFSLTNRSKMRYPALLGRNLLNGNFLVDVSVKNLSYKLKTGKKRKL
ncbi:ATP-dependent zinc protease family protein [Limisalsivibrio acetivorans]|uniref:ATP-dependent zinc protease family protein n=1 Tax=Limisalsivibrio acetivorans TaxID=1304888 RepID=UPI0003B6844D|nr:RimK/LysX family protein [Limisalsivibrio acetivorans]